MGKQKSQKQPNSSHPVTKSLYSGETTTGDLNTVLQVIHTKKKSHVSSSWK